MTASFCKKIHIYNYIKDIYKQLHIIWRPVAFIRAPSKENLEYSLVIVEYL